MRGQEGRTEVTRPSTPRTRTGGSGPSRKGLAEPEPRGPGNQAQPWGRQEVGRRTADSLKVTPGAPHPLLAVKGLSDGEPVEKVRE